MNRPTKEEIVKRQQEMAPVINKRDREIYNKYKSGASLEALSKEYGLSVDHIKFIFKKHGVK